jgi:hypothetical protein
MKRFCLLFSIFVCTAAAAFAQNPKQDSGLPQLHAIRTVTLSPTYSCRSSEDFQKGYESTALFLSTFAKQFSRPDLVFNGGCGAEDYFRASTGGDDFSLIADLGINVALEEVSASRAFNFKRVHSFAEYSKFADLVKVVANHTYAVLLNNSDKRGLVIFTVDEYVPNKRVVLRYAVKSYQIPGQIRSEGFDWARTNN